MSLVVLVGSGWAWATYRSFNANIKRVQLSTHSSATAKNIDGSDQNILIVGNDDRDTATNSELAQLGTTRDGGSYNTDTMMLLHVPADGRKATVISFPRDSYVAIPGHGMNKLNSAYPDGVRDGNGSKDAGASLLADTISNLTGLSIDHFVQVDLLGFYRISNAIGGVSVCLNAAMGPATQVGQDGPRTGLRNRAGRHLRQELFRDQPEEGCQRHLRQAGAGLRPAAARPAARRPGPDQAPAVLPVGGLSQAGLRWHAAEPVQAAAPAQARSPPR